MIYFVRDDISGLVKIGHSARLSHRLWKIGCHGSPTVLGVTDGHRPQERSLHGLFAEFRVKGEWFRDVPEIRDYVAAFCRQWDGLDEDQPHLSLQGPPSVSLGDGKPIIVAIRGSKEFKEWLARYAHANRMSVASIIERALAIAADLDKFEAPPPR